MPHPPRTAPASADLLTLERDGAVALVTMRRPERRNALSPELDAALIEALEACAEDEAVRAVVLTGAGAGFCAGADLSAFGALATPERVYDHLTERYGRIVTLLATMPKPTLAAVGGAAAGAGVSLALACDLRVMAPDAALVMAFSSLGLVPDAGASYLLARQVGYARAFELAAEARPLPADRCLALGLCNRIAAADAVVDETLAWAHRLAARPTAALGMTKAALHHAMQHDLASTIEHEARLQMRAIATRDHREGVAAFLERREPRFEGR